MEHVKENSNRISKYFNLPPLRQLEQEERLEQENKYYTPTYTMVQPNYIFGVEVEVENVPYPEILPHHTSYWNITQDNSLRNAGYEFVSMPLKAKYLENALNQLKNSLPNSADFSPRTSVHVHMNVRDLTIEQISSLVILYITCENLLFNWVGHERDKSVFCIKLLETNYRKDILHLLDSVSYIVHHWNKYTALNLHPICSIGTVEFRHMEGNIHIPRILTWINFLSCLKSYTKTTSIQKLLHTVMNLNSSSEYKPFLESVFKNLTINLLDNASDEDIQNAMEEAVSYVKTTYNVLDSSKKQPQVDGDAVDNMLRGLTQRIAENPRPERVPRTLNDYMIQRQVEIQAGATAVQPQTEQIRGQNPAQPRPFFITTTGQVGFGFNVAEAEDPIRLDETINDFLRGTP